MLVDNVAFFWHRVVQSEKIHEVQHFGKQNRSIIRTLTKHQYFTVSATKKRTNVRQLY